MKSKDVKTILNLALRLTVIVAAVVLMLATVNAVTKDRIAENNEKSRNEACGALIEGAEFESYDISSLDIDYGDITHFDKSSVAVWRGTKDGALAGWCVEVTGKGYSSDGIGLIVGISADGKTVLGVKGVSSSETSGIEGDGRELSFRFRRQFDGRRFRDRRRFGRDKNVTRRQRRHPRRSRVC